MEKEPRTPQRSLSHSLKRPTRSIFTRRFAAWVCGGESSTPVEEGLLSKNTQKTSHKLFVSRSAPINNQRHPLCPHLWRAHLSRQGQEGLVEAAVAHELDQLVFGRGDVDQLTTEHVGQLTLQQPNAQGGGKRSAASRVSYNSQEPLRARHAPATHRSPSLTDRRRR